MSGEGGVTEERPAPAPVAAAAAAAPSATPQAMDAAQLINALRELRGMAQDATYWQRLCLCLLPLCRARSAQIVRVVDGPAWQMLASSAPDATSPDDVAARLQELGPRALAQGHAYAPGAAGWLNAAVRLVDPAGLTLAVLEISARERSAIGELLLRVQLIADLPASGSTSGASAGTPGGNDLAELLDLVARVMGEGEFGAASLTLVNLLATTLGCDQVVLASNEDGYARVQAISHIDRFERKAENVQLLEAAIEEACDQQTDLVHPAAADAPGTGAVLLAHDRLARMLGYGQLATLLAPGETPGPLPLALLLARREGAFDPVRLQQVSVALHLLQPWFTNLRQRSGWWGERAWAATRRHAADWLSPKRPGRKLLVALALLALLGVSLGTWPYRIDASGELATDAVQVISAPFDGYMSQVHANLGDTVQSGAVLAQLDTRELTLQAADLQSEVRRYDAEADRARAQGQMADMQIAVARTQQSRARMERVMFQLGQSQVHAPFTGVVVEGERKELAGVPVRQGDKLFRLARIEGLYAVIQLSERDVHDLPANATGQLRLLSQPDRPIGFAVDRLVPIARVKGSQGGQFLLKARLDVASEAWWRPGMTGLAQIDVGERRILWIWTHHLVDRVRLALWW
ncbi:MAG: efflux RND transporter periplasmic adaptor subunit [Leptothrix sp. (in: b-proteobacteria)]